MTKHRITPFMRLTKRSHEYAQGYRAATKDCATWLSDTADERGKKAAPILRKASVTMAREAKDIAWEGRDDMQTNGAQEGGV